MPDQEHLVSDWIETQPGYGHGFPPYIPNMGKTKLLSRGGSAIRQKARTKLNEADRYFLAHLWNRYRSTPFKRGDLDAGRINRLLGREIVFATENVDPFSLETMLRIEIADELSVPKPPARQFRYGEKSTTEIVLDVVRSVGRPVSGAEIGARVIDQIPGFRPTNIFPDLSTLSVNCFSRGNYSANRRPRRTDSGHSKDKLIKIAAKGGPLYDLYDPKTHGIWGLVDVGDKVLRPRLLSAPDAAELADARQAISAEGLFDSHEDARKRIMAAIVQREGQPAFRQELLRAYGGACAISGCSVEALLEAAHIVPYLGPHTNVVDNGLLLRADIHKLFDLHLLSIDPETRIVRVCDLLMQSEYKQFNNVRLRQAEPLQQGPSSKALKHHYERCAWLNIDAASKDEA